MGEAIISPELFPFNDIQKADVKKGRLKNFVSAMHLHHYLPPSNSTHHYMYTDTFLARTIRLAAMTLIDV